MRIILSDTDLSGFSFAPDVQVVKTGIQNLADYRGNEDVAVIVGSRAMAIEAAGIDFPALKLFQLTSAGFDGVPLAQYREKGVAVSNAGGVYSAPIAETVIFGMLLMAKKLHHNPNNRRIKLRRHYDATITEIAGKRVLILGTGSIGTAIAGRLQGFEATVDGYNRSGGAKPEFARILSGREELLAHVGEYDYLLSTLPDSAETRGFLNREVLDKLAKNAVIVNVGRKAVFNEDDLYRTLKQRRIGGAVLDMFEKLPNPVTNRFRRLSNVIVLPGVSAVSGEVKARLRAHICRNVSAALSAETIANVINAAP